MTYAAFRSIGAYIPPKIMTNADFEKIIDTSDEWITKRTGIKERRISEVDEASSDLGARAAKLAIERAGIANEDIDLVICATVTPDYLCMPSTACLISAKIGLPPVMAFDISAACTGFVYAISIAKAFIESGMKKNVLIIGAETYTSILDYTDRGTCFIFGDGAGQTLQIATVVVFIVCVIAGFLFYRDLPDFKISMQGFMQSQKKWKCRECDHEWEI